MNRASSVDPAHRVLDVRIELPIKCLQRRHGRAGDDILDVAGEWGRYAVRNAFFIEVGRAGPPAERDCVVNRQMYDRHRAGGADWARLLTVPVAAREVAA